MYKRGFTLIELLIVITIIAILAGAAIPYVQDYVDDARYARAKADLTEIRNALVRFETDRSTLYTSANISELVGPYLQKVLVDPWGAPYNVNSNGSSVFSSGPDGNPATLGDNVAESYRPPLALSKAYWEDTNLNGIVDANDSMIFKFTRPTSVPANLAFADFTFLTGALVFGGTAWNSSRTEAKVPLTTVTTPFVPGKDTIVVTGTNIKDGTAPTPIDCKIGLPMPIRAR